ncbi:Hypothetical_protein [Hexamita inflata]|uniref:Hypothetical_protein n=1 Tax=Hexamita inflata TaxID=28002 RepID=A0AA86TSV0_9EUKA|nr:Hypothetical protein HINF_LOCUS15314 [Hexamita inflata]
MMTCKVIRERSYNEDFNDLNIYKQLELGCSGLQLKREVLINLFGEEFPNQLKHCYDVYIQDQIDRFPIYMQNCDSLLPFSIQQKFLTNQCLEKQDQISSLIFQIRKQEQNLHLQLETVSQKLNLAVSQFLQLNSEVCQ